MSLEKSRILVTGATGFLGKRVCNLLETQAVEHVKTSLSLGVDLCCEQSVTALFNEVKPIYVLNCAAYVGGIQFGLKHAAELFDINMQMTLNLLRACYKSQVTRLVNPISNCAYPGEATLFREDEFWDGSLHESVMVYGLVRKAFWVASWAYHKQYGMDIVNLILANMYGPEDHFEAERSHALGALIMKFVEAKQSGEPKVQVWGSGKPVREWLHVDDGAEAMVRAMKIKRHVDPINIGVGKGISIIDLANLIKQEVGYTGEIQLDLSKEDGAPYKTMDGSKGFEIMNWGPTEGLTQGVKGTIDWYVHSYKKLQSND